MEPPGVSSGSAALTVTPLVARGEIESDLTQLASFEALDQALAQERTPNLPYRALTERDCQCLAVQASSTANMLDQKASRSIEQAELTGHHHNEVSRTAIVKEGLLRDAALELRNRAAGDALEIFYRLTEAEGKRDVLVMSLAQLDEAIEEGKQLEVRGFPRSETFDNLRDQHRTSLDAQVELDLLIERLNSELRQRLNLGPQDEHWRTWPVADLSVVPEPIDPEGAVALALEKRSELITLRRLGGSIDPKTASMIRTLMGQYHALLELSSRDEITAWKLLARLLRTPRASKEELHDLQREIQALRGERERAITEQIRQDLETLSARLRQVAIAREEVDAHNRDLVEFEARSARGIQTFPKLTLTRLKSLEAKGRLIEKVMSWRIARIRLSEHQGMLTVGCGPVACLIPNVQTEIR